MKDYKHERFTAYVPEWNKIAWFKEFPYLTSISCEYLNSNFQYYYDTQKNNVGVLKLEFEDGDFVITSSKTSLRKRIAEITSDAVTFSKSKIKGPLVIQVGVRLYQNQTVKVHLLSEDPTMKKQILQELQDA